MRRLPNLLPWSVYANQLSVKLGTRTNRLMDACRLADKIGVKGTGDETGVVWMRAVPADKMPAIESQESPSLSRRETQYDLVRFRLAGLPSFLRGQHVATESA